MSALCPGAIRTPIFTYGKYGRVGTGMPPEVTREFWEKLRPMAPDVFARGALDAVERNQGVIVLPRWWRALWWLERASPVLSAALSRRLYESTRAAAFRR